MIESRQAVLLDAIVLEEHSIGIFRELERIPVHNRNQSFQTSIDKTRRVKCTLLLPNYLICMVMENNNAGWHVFDLESQQPT